ncbi:MAG TPA: TolC family protein [Candidatus Angelobacter sp.]|jgi:cobalt-zinc-cadmium efflux system outer membrane protein|nr:TolC family protein [Candidatus Angelobacter sp.]
MPVLLTRLYLGLFLALVLVQGSFAQKALTWQEVRDKFQASNPTLQAGKLSIDESKAQEITAYLRPNPQFTQTADGTQIAPFQGTWKPFSGTDLSPSFSYLHERRNKRELRLESAQKATGIAVSTQADLERTLIFNLRTAFIQTIQQKAILQLAKENLSYYDHLLDVNRERYKAGAIARVDLDRLELQRVTYESDLQTAEVNLRTAKIQLLALLNDRTPVEQFDVAGPFDFSSQLTPLDEIRQTALDTRPDLRAALQSIDKAKTDHKLAVANGSTDPTLSSWYTYNPSFNNPFAHYTLGTSVSIPLRIFDRNQGEKRRTSLDIDRNEKLMEATRAQVFNDVDSAYATVNSTITRLQPYKDRYLQQASRVRETVAFSYQHGAASLLDFLNAQADYRSVQVSYLNLVGSYLSAANQLNLAVGREVIP